jgi:hypothetical protein
VNNFQWIVLIVYHELMVISRQAQFPLRAALVGCILEEEIKHEGHEGVQR